MSTKVQWFWPQSFVHKAGSSKSPSTAGRAQGYPEKNTVPKEEHYVLCKAPTAENF